MRNKMPLCYADPFSHAVYTLQCISGYALAGCCFPPNSVGNIPKIHKLRYKYCHGLKVYTIEKTLLWNIVCFRGFLSGYQHLKG